MLFGFGSLFFNICKIFLTKVQFYKTYRCNIRSQYILNIHNLSVSFLEVYLTEEVTFRLETGDRVGLMEKWVQENRPCLKC
jgi:hypothetical protein